MLTSCNTNDALWPWMYFLCEITDASWAGPSADRAGRFKVKAGYSVSLCRLSSCQDDVWQTFSLHQLMVRVVELDSVTGMLASFYSERPVDLKYLMTSL